MMDLFSGQGPELSRKKFYTLLLTMIIAGAICAFGIACLLRGVMRGLNTMSKQAAHEMMAKPAKR